MLSERLMLPENVCHLNNQTNKQIGLWHIKRAINFGHECIQFAADFVKRGRLYSMLSEKLLPENVLMAPLEGIATFL